MVTLAAIADILDFLAERTKFHSRIIMAIATIFGAAGLVLLSLAFARPDPQGVVMVGGGLFIGMLLFLYKKIRHLQKQALVMGMVVAGIRRIQDEAATERLRKLTGEMVGPAEPTETGPEPLEEILEFVERLEGRQRRNLIATSIGFLVVVGLVGAIAGTWYLEGKSDTPGVAIPRPEQIARGLERVSELARQAIRKTQPAKEEPPPPRQQELQVPVEAEELNREGAPAKQEPPANAEKLVALQQEISALQQELSVARRQLKEERQKVAVLEEKTGAHRKDASGLQKRSEALGKTVTDREYLRLVSEAFAYTYRKGPGDVERAETAYRNAIRIARAKSIRDPVVYNAYAGFLQGQRRFKEAEKFYQMALGINPGYGPALNNLGTLYEVTGKLEEALRKYKAAYDAGEKLGAQNYSRLHSVITK